MLTYGKIVSFGHKDGARVYVGINLRKEYGELRGNLVRGISFVANSKNQ
jgi:hypothetical protein